MKATEEIQESWNRSRTIMICYLWAFLIVLSAYYFYQHSVRYIQSYDQNCAAPGHFYSEIWSWNFVLQASYALCLLPYVGVAFTMYGLWFNRTPYYIFAVYTVFLTGYIWGTTVYLSIQAGQANTCASVGNPFNDFRICGVCGLQLAWAQQCFGTAPYNPPITGPLYLNAPKVFQLAFSWIFVIFITFSLFYTTTYYISIQDKYTEMLTISIPQKDLEEGNGNKIDEKKISNVPSKTQEKDLVSKLPSGMEIKRKIPRNLFVK